MAGPPQRVNPLSCVGKNRGVHEAVVALLPDLVVLDQKFPLNEGKSPIKHSQDSNPDSPSQTAVANATRPQAA